MESGIYCIRNIVDGKMYIGRSNHLPKRRKTHEWLLRENRHFNVHLQRAYNLNPKAFVFEVLEECDENLLNEKEVFYISKYNTMNMEYGYNLCEGGKSTTGRICTDETRAKISAKTRGRKCSEDVVKKRTQSLKDHIANDPEFARYHYEYCSKGAKGKPSWNKGRPCSEEKKKHLSELFKGKPRKSEKDKQHMRELFTGEKSCSAILTEKEAIDLKIRFLNGEKRMDIARSFPKVSPQTIYDCVKGRRWKHLPNSIEELERMKNGRKISQTTEC